MSSPWVESSSDILSSHFGRVVSYIISSFLCWFHHFCHQPRFTSVGTSYHKYEIFDCTETTIHKFVNLSKSCGNSCFFACILNYLGTFLCLLDNIHWLNIIKTHSRFTLSFDVLPNFGHITRHQFLQLIKCGEENYVLLILSYVFFQILSGLIDVYKSNIIIDKLSLKCKYIRNRTIFTAMV